MNEGMTPLVEVSCGGGCDEDTIDFEGKRSTGAGVSSNAGSVLALDNILLSNPGFGGLVAVVETVGFRGEMNKSDRSLVNLGVCVVDLFGVAGREGVLLASKVNN